MTNYGCLEPVILWTKPMLAPESVDPATVCAIRIRVCKLTEFAVPAHVLRPARRLFVVGEAETALALANGLDASRQPQWLEPGLCG